MSDALQNVENSFRYRAERREDQIRAQQAKAQKMLWMLRQRIY
jgi:hypothetical protein